MLPQLTVYQDHFDLLEALGDTRFAEVSRVNILVIAIPGDEAWVRRLTPSQLDVFVRERVQLFFEGLAWRRKQGFFEHLSINTKFPFHCIHTVDWRERIYTAVIDEHKEVGVKEWHDYY